MRSRNKGYHSLGRKQKSILFLFVFLCIGIIFYIVFIKSKFNIDQLFVGSNQQTATASQPLLTSPDTVFEKNLDYKIGISIGNTLYGMKSSELSKQLDDMVNLGVGWLRFDMSWGDIQQDNSQDFDWSKIDRIVLAAHERNIKLLPILTYTPAWARPFDCIDDKCAPLDPSQFAYYAGEAVKRYSKQGIYAWEIWNEPNIEAFWRPKPDVVAYTELLKKTYLTMKAQDPSVIIISGGLSPSSDNGVNIAPTTFLAGIYKNGGKNYFDAVGFHPYTYPQMPFAILGGHAWKQIETTNPSIKSVMTAYNDNSKYIWFTEYGAPTDGPRSISEDQQSKMLLESLSFHNNMSQAGPFFWYSYKDIGDTFETNENFFGIIRYDGTRKPAYDTLKTFIEQN